MAVQLTTFGSKLCLKFSYSLRAKPDTHFSCDSHKAHSLHSEVSTSLNEAKDFCHLFSYYVCISFVPPPHFPSPPNSDNKIQVTFILTTTSSNNQFCLFF